MAKRVLWRSLATYIPGTLGTGGVSLGSATYRLQRQSNLVNPTRLPSPSFSLICLSPLSQSHGS